MRRITKNSWIAGLIVAMLFLGESGIMATPSSDTLAHSTPKDSSSWKGVSLRTNLVYAATASANLGVDFAVGNHFSLGANLGLKAWPRWLAWDLDKENPKKWKHILVAPELRWWPEQVYQHGFIGVDLIWSHFNVGSVQFPFGMYKQVCDQRLQGDLWAAGLFGGWSWRLARHWRIEAEAGIGVGYYGAQRYECAHCGAPLGPADGIAIIPKLGVNIVWDITAQEKPKDRKKREAARKELLEQINQINTNN